MEEKTAVQDSKELSYAYISNEIPLLIGGTVFRKEHEVLKSVGDHLVCALGYRAKGTDESDSKINLMGRAVDRIYVHDDRYGPYLSWREVQVDIPIAGASDESTTRNATVWEYGLKDETDAIIGDREEYFLPDLVICGMNHKIRIPFSEVLNSCEAFTRYIEQDMLLIKSQSEGDEYVKDLADSIGAALGCSWSIFLTTSTKYKKELRGLTEFKHFNGAADRNALLLQSLPKHLWLCRLENPDGQFMDILFDATEVPQGNTLIGFVIYSDLADTMMRLVEASVRQRNWAKYSATDEDKVNVRPFVTFFNEVPDRQLLNTQYGLLRTPSRGLSEYEQDDTNNVTQTDARTISAFGSVFWNAFLDESQKYIWVVDVSGNLVIGIEDDNIKHGHPTLIDGRPARLGGQLKFNKDSGRWVVDLFSQAYSSHLRKPSPVANAYLDNVVENLLEGLNVDTYYGDPDYVASSRE